MKAGTLKLTGKPAGSSAIWRVFPGSPACPEHLSAVLTVYLHLGREGPGETGQFQKHPEAFGLLTS